MALPQGKHDAPISRAYQYEDVVRFSNNFSKKLGEGGFGTVYEGTIPGESNKIVAIKKFREPRDANDEVTLLSQFENEKNWLPKFHHKNIIKMLGHCSSQQHRCLIIEHGSSLKEKIENLNWEKVIEIIVNLARGINYLHCVPGGLVHGDLKPDNILLTEEYDPRIIDFGSCVRENEFVEHITYTYGYADPEITLQELAKDRPRKCKRQTDDVYAFGITILQLIMRWRKPYQGTYGTLNTEALELIAGRDLFDKSGHRIIKRRMGTKLIGQAARELFDKDGHCVEKSLMGTGCTLQAAKEISKLALSLTKESPTMEQSPPMREHVGMKSEETQEHPETELQSAEIEQTREIIETAQSQEHTETTELPMLLRGQVQVPTEGEYIRRPKMIDILRILEKIKDPKEQVLSGQDI